MNPLYKELTNEQKCAVLGFAIDFCGFKEPSSRQFSELQELLAKIFEELEISREEVEAFVCKMQKNGRLAYAIRVLKTIKDERMHGSFYPYYYSVVATLESREGLAKLDKIFNDEFGYDKEQIQLIWDLYEIKDFRKKFPTKNTTVTSTSSGNGCMVLVLAISTSIFACLCGMIMMLV